MKGLALAIALLAAPLPQEGKTAPLDPGELWAEGGNGDHGATRDYYNAPGFLRWRRSLGDWLDAEGKPYGDASFGETELDDATPKFIAWDVTRLVQRWVDGSLPNKGFFLRCSAGGGTFKFRSRESADASQHPQLVVDGRTLAPQADTYLERSTYTGMGSKDTLNLSPVNPVLLRFLLEGLAGPVKSATLKLFLTARSGSRTRAGVFLCDSGLKGSGSAAPAAGLAARYPDDRGLAKDPAVFLSSDFEADDWGRSWSNGTDSGTLTPVADDPERRLEAFQGRALRVRIPKGSNAGMNVDYQFAKKNGSEPEEVYLRYYLRFSGDWQTIQGGKLPGIAGTYGRAGWGGRKVNGTDGWSARGSFNISPSPGNPLAGRIPVGSYVYHADMPGDYGDIWIWLDGYRGILVKDRWYCMEQQVKLNTPGQKDGILRAWVDGRLSFEKTDLRFRDVAALKIERVWMNIYHGGKLPTDRDVHAYVDNVVIARQYVGPMVRSR